MSGLQVTEGTNMTTSIACNNGLTLDIADDFMSATLTLNREENESPITEANIIDALKNSGLEINERVEKRATEFVQQYTNDENQEEPFVITKGIPHFEGKDETFQWETSLEEQQKSWQDDSQVNYYNLSNIVTVEKDVVIGIIDPMKPQRKGADIKGKILKPRERPPKSFKLDHTVRKDDANPNKLISNTAGCVDISNNSIHVDEVLSVKGDVGFSSGNIDSDVAVHVTGSIPDRFEVHAKKSITVELAIEAAFVESAEDVNVRRGIVGRNAGKVYAKNNIVAKFCSEANMVADGNLVVTSQLLNSRAQTNGKFIGTHASIIGGHLYTVMGGEATDLGSEAGTQTRIFIGPNPDAPGENAAIEEEIQAKRNAIQQIKDTVQPLLDNTKHLAPNQKEQATELLFKAQEAESHLEEEETRKKELVITSDSHSDAKFTVSGTIYGHVTISFGQRVVSFKDDFKGPVTLEVRKVENVTEVVAVNTLTGSVTILKSRKITDEELQKDFSPIAEMLRMKVTASTGNAVENPTPEPPSP